MHARLTSYLRDNRDQIIENWLLEAEIPAVEDSETETPAIGTVPTTFLEQAFESTIEVIQTGKTAPSPTTGIHLDHILGVTCTCKQRAFGGRVCIELHDAGLTAFMSVFDEKWDTAHEFNEFDRKHFADLINHALSGVFGSEIEHCNYKHFRSDCPFIAGTSKTIT